MNKCLSLSLNAACSIILRQATRLTPWQHSHFCVISEGRKACRTSGNRPWPSLVMAHHELGWHELGWHELGWHELGWQELGWHELGRHEQTNHPNAYEPI